jgi:hypothetical protein
MIPKDILILDASHGGIAEDTGSEAYFALHGLQTVFAGCEGRLKDWDNRIGRDSVLGAFVSVSATGPGAIRSASSSRSDGSPFRRVSRVSITLRSLGRCFGGLGSSTVPPPMVRIGEYDLKTNLSPRAATVGVSEMNWI